MNERDFNYPIMPVIKERWSPRAFDPARPVSKDDLMALIEAARYAPSCMNEQPWVYLIARSEALRSRLLSCLSPKNMTWADKAPVLMVLMARKTFEDNGKLNRWHLFDAGTAWGYLSLEAASRGLITHAMGGIQTEKIRTEFEIPEDFDIIAGLAVGYYGDKASLSPDLQAREFPQSREPLDRLIFLDG